MTTIKHHISDELLMGYAAGALPQAFDLVVASHVSLSPVARARLEGFEALGGAVLEDIDGATVSDDCLERLFARFELEGANDDKAPEDAEPVLPARDSVLPGPLLKAVGGGLDAIRWRSIGLGVKQAVLHSDDTGSVRLLYIPAGQEMPKHSHRGLEMTLVLQGAYRDEEDRFARGDIEIANEDTHHTPIAEEGEDCICLAATDAPLKFDGLLPRIAQPFIGI